MLKYKRVKAKEITCGMYCYGSLWYMPHESEDRFHK